MINDIYLDASIARILFFTIPAVVIIITIVLNVVHTKLSAKGHRKVLGWLVDPLPIKPIFERRKGAADGNTPKPSLGKRVKYVLGQISLRFLFFILFAVLVAAGLELSVFLHEGGHGVIGELVGGTWQLIRLGFFNGSCWVPLPLSIDPMDGPAYFISRSWISVSGNLVETLFGTGFLLLLLVPQVKKSFFASLFFLGEGFGGISTSLMAWYGQSWQVLYGNPLVNSDTRNFLSYQIFLATGLDAANMLIITTAIMVPVVVVGILVPGLLWRVHYPKYRFSHWWFIGLVQAVWWAAFLATGSFF
nr:hypothetical protein [Candidatus Sigynarchaeota archaeon]